MIEGIASFFTTFKQVAPVPLIAISVATGLVLFCPLALARTFGVDEFREPYRGWIGGAFILSLSYLTAHFAWWLRSVIVDTRKRNQVERRRQQLLHDLTAEEKAYLARFVFDDVNTQYFKIDDGIAGGLMRKDIIYRASIACYPHRGFPYNLNPWARDYLRKNPQLLDGAIKLSQDSH